MAQVCRICPYKTFSTTDYVRHFDKNHRLSVKCRFACGVESCSLRFSTLQPYKFHFDIHLESSSSEEKSYVCDLCSYAAKCSSTLKNHKFRKHKNHQTLPVENVIEIETSTPELLILQENEFPEPCPIVDVETTPACEVDDYIIKLKNEVTERFLNLYLTLNSTKHVPEPVLQMMVDKYLILLRDCAEILSCDLVAALKENGFNDPSIFDIVKRSAMKNIAIEIHESGVLRSSYMRQKNFKLADSYVEPSSHYLGLNDRNKRRKFHSVSISKWLAQLLREKSIEREMLVDFTTRQSNDGYIRDVVDGSLFKQLIHQYSAQTIFIIIYSDDLELSNCLGPAKGSNKVTNVYIIVVNFQPWTRLKNGYVFLGLTCREKDIAYFGLEKVMQPLVEELTILEREGLKLGNGIKVKVVLLCLLGDNLGTHTLTGFLENFSKAHYFCVYCEESRLEWRRRWYGNVDNLDFDSDDENAIQSDESENEDEDISDLENENPSDISHDEIDTSEEPIPNVEVAGVNPALLRTEKSYDDCVDYVNQHGLDSWKGIVAQCQFNKLPYFHCNLRAAACISHDIFEGCLPADLSLALQHLSKKFSFTGEMLNRQIENFQFLSSDKLDRPGPISGKSMAVKGNAIQNLVLLRFLPALLSNYISDKTDPMWRFVLVMRRMVLNLCSPAVSHAFLPDLRRLIYYYLYLRRTLFPDKPLRPKHHYLEHYDFLIKRFGSLMRVSTLLLESKHCFFKDTLRYKRSVKNLTKLLSTEFQLMMSATKTMIDNEPSILYSHSFLSSQLASNVSDHFKFLFGERCFQAMAFGSRVSFRNIEYSAGEVIVTCSKDYKRLRVFVIQALGILQKECFVVGSWAQALLLKGSGLHTLKRSTEETVVQKLEVLTSTDYFPYPIYSWDGKEVLIIKHLAEQLS